VLLEPVGRVHCVQPAPVPGLALIPGPAQIPGLALILEPALILELGSIRGLAQVPGLWWFAALALAVSAHWTSFGSAGAEV